MYPIFLCVWAARPILYPMFSCLSSLKQGLYPVCRRPWENSEVYSISSDSFSVIRVWTESISYVLSMWEQRDTFYMFRSLSLESGQNLYCLCCLCEISETQSISYVSFCHHRDSLYRMFVSLFVSSKPESVSYVSCQCEQRARFCILFPLCVNSEPNICILCFHSVWTARYILYSVSTMWTASQTQPQRRKTLLPVEHVAKAETKKLQLLR